MDQFAPTRDILTVHQKILVESQNCSKSIQTFWLYFFIVFFGFSGLVCTQKIGDFCIVNNGKSKNGLVCVHKNAGLLIKISLIRVV